MRLKPINQQVVVVMGASRGIGRETALRLAAMGATLVLSSRSEIGLRSLVDEIRRRGGAAIAVPADVSQFEQVQAVAEAAVREFGRIDTWVHVAAVAVYAPFAMTSPVEFRRVLDVNLLGQAHGAMAALPFLRREGRGALIHVSSVAARRALPLLSAYSASKHGIIGLLDSLRVELRRENSGVSVTNIMPASINTPLFNTALTRLGVKPRPIPPVYEAGVVADSIIYAAQHPVRDLVAGAAGHVLTIGQRLSPVLMDALLLGAGFTTQMTNEPKPASAPNNLFTPIPGYFDKVAGDFSAEALATSLFTQLKLTWPAQLLRSGARSALGVVGLVGNLARLRGAGLRARASVNIPPSGMRPTLDAEVEVQGPLQPPFAPALRRPPALGEGQAPFAPQAQPQAQPAPQVRPGGPQPRFPA